MPDPDIVFVTAGQMPKPDLYTPLLSNQLAQMGVPTLTVPWDRPFDWSSSPITILRSPWNYTQAIPGFLEWLALADSCTRLINPFETVRWNIHKGYLADLARNGVPIVPTRFYQQRSFDFRIEETGFRNSEELIAKPAIGSGARGGMKGRFDSPDFMEHIASLRKRFDVLVQPFVQNVADFGEVSLIYFDGEYSHSVHKRPASGDFRVQELYGGTVHPFEPGEAELKVAQAAMSACPSPPVYARVDIVYHDDAPVVMELELIEPELFLRFSEAGLRCFSGLLKELLQK